MKDNKAKLLKYLQKIEDWVSADELAIRLNLTSRTIRHYVSEINSSNQGGQALILSSRNGYRVNLRQGQPKDTTKKDANTKTPSQRFEQIVSILLNDECLTIVSLFEKFHISEGTLNNDIINLRKYLSKFDLKLECKKNLMYLSGSEFDKRRLACVYYKKIEPSPMFGKSALQDLLPGFDHAWLRNILFDKVKRHGLFFNSYAVYHILFNLIVSVWRSQRNPDIQPGDIRRFEHVSKYPAYPAAVEILAAISKKYAYSFGTYEAYHFSVILTAMTYCATEKNKKSFEKLYPIPNLIKFCMRCLKSASGKYGFDLHNGKIAEQFVWHIRSLIFRVKHKLSYNKLRAISIKDTHPYFYDIAIYLSRLIQKEYDICFAEDEIALISMLIGYSLHRENKTGEKLTCILICPVYYDLQDYFLNKLNQHFGDTLEIDQMVTEYDSSKTFQKDIIISVYQFRELADTVTISPFIAENDLNLIRKKIISVKRNKQLKLLSKYIRQYSCADLFEKNKYFEKPEQAILYMCNRLMALDYVNCDFFDQVMERENISSTAFGIIAVPHTVELAAKKNAIYFIINQDRIEWGGAHVQVIALIAMSADNQKEFYDVYTSFTEVMADTEYLKKLLQAKDYTEFLDVFSD